MKMPVSMNRYSVSELPVMNAISFLWLNAIRTTVDLEEATLATVSVSEPKDQNSGPCTVCCVISEENTKLAMQLLVA